METDDSVYKTFPYKLHQSLMMMITMSPFLLIRFTSKLNQPRHT